MAAKINSLAALVSLQASHHHHNSTPFYFSPFSPHLSTTLTSRRRSLRSAVVAQSTAGTQSKAPSDVDLAAVSGQDRLLKVSFSFFFLNFFYCFNLICCCGDGDDFEMCLVGEKVWKKRRNWKIEF